VNPNEQDPPQAPDPCSSKAKSDPPATPRPPLVRGYDKDMRTEESLGETTADDEGRYEIRYTAAQFRRAEKGSADLRIAVVNDDGREIASSNIVFNAGPETTIDAIAGGRQAQTTPEYEALVAELAPVIQGVPLWELTDDDMTFLARREPRRSPADRLAR
jgi:hypothetical protein